ncbi:hypothetical protein Tco_1263891 [Tanacetum coccineum]
MGIRIPGAARAFAVANTEPCRCANAYRGRCSTVSPSGDEGVRPLRDGEEPLLESTAGRTMELVLEQPEVESTDVLAPTPLRSVPGATVEPPRLDATSVGSSEDADVAGAESDAGEVGSGLKRKRAASDDGAGTSKRVRHVSSESHRLSEETPMRHPLIAAKDVPDTPAVPQVSNLASMSVHVEATSDSSAPVTHAAQSPSQTSPLTADDISRRDRETGPKAFEGMPVDQLMEEFDMKDEEILLLKTQLADAQAEAESSRSYAQKLAEEKMALLVKVEQERANSADYKASCHWAVKYSGGGTLESQEVKQSFGDVVKCALAHGDELLGCTHIAQLERDQDYPIGVIMAGLTLARHAIEGAEAQPDYFLKPDVAQLQVPIFACPRDILNPFALEKEIPFEGVLESHAI